MRRVDLVDYLDRFLAIETIQDYGENGLQVEGADEVALLAYAVDACQETIDAAVKGKASMLMVHHGLFWGKPLLVVGPHRKRLKALLDGDCSLYAAHLPLDLHAQVGNNVELARRLGFQIEGRFGLAFGNPIGVVAEAPSALSRELLVAKVAEVCGGSPVVLPGGPQVVRRVGLMSGNAPREVMSALTAGCDTYITGETDHASFHLAFEYGVNVICAGHYATETFGIKALSMHIEQELGIPGFFIDRPTGL